MENQLIAELQKYNTYIYSNKSDFYFYQQNFDVVKKGFIGIEFLHKHKSYLLGSLCFNQAVKTFKVKKISQYESIFEIFFEDKNCIKIKAINI